MPVFAATATVVLSALASGLAGGISAGAATGSDNRGTRWQMTVLPALPKRPIGAATDINDRGQVVGTSAFLVGNGEHASLNCHAVLWTGGPALDLSKAAGESMGWGACEVYINNRPQVVLHGRGYQAYLWEAGRIRALGRLPGADDSHAAAINERGDVIGMSSDWAGSDRGFIWRRGSMTDLGSLGAGGTMPTALNDRGWVVGRSVTKEDRRDGGWHAFLWRHGRMTNLGTLGGTYSRAEAINNRGEVVGASNTRRYSLRAVLWRHGTAISVGAPPRAKARYPVISEAIAINSRGQIIAVSREASAGEERAFLWDQGKLTDLGTLGGCCSIPRAINDRGQIVGESLTKGDGMHAFVWENGKMTDLGVRGESSSAADINERSQIVGTNNDHAVIWNLRQ